MATVLYCNKCGKKIDNMHVFSGLSVTKRLEYGSKYDLDLLELDLCGDCLDKIIDECAITPVAAEV